MLIFRQLFDQQSSTYTYLLADSATAEAVLIDPVFEQVRRDMALIEELRLRLLYTIDTHIHADHVTGAWMLKRRTGSQIAISAASGAEGADRYLSHGDRCGFGTRHLTVRATPGHTNGCISLVLDDETMAFTGDCLLIRGTGRTDFQSGDARAMFRAVHEQIFTLPDTCLLYPAHDYRGLTVTSAGEERRFNPRLGGELCEDDFAVYMTNLRLPHPRQIDVAVPANLKCGIAASDPTQMEEPGWAPLTYNFAEAHFSGRAGRAYQRTRAGTPGRDGLPGRRTFSTSHGYPAAGWIRGRRQPRRRHAPLACGRPCCREREHVGASSNDDEPSAVHCPFSPYIGTEKPNGRNATREWLLVADVI